MYCQNDYRSYLAHHGILGQKWYVRRFQNPDGSLTSEGRLRYGSKSRRSSLKGPAYSGTVNKSKTDDLLTRYKKKQEEKYKRMNSEDYSDKTANLARLALNIGLDIVVFPVNPAYAVIDTATIIKAVHGNAKANKFEKERAQCKTDSKTGFKLKNRQMSDKEDLERVNPRFTNFDSNTKSNCMLCTTTYDLRKRGYEVTAKTAGAGFFNKDLKSWYPNAKVKTVEAKGPGKDAPISEKLKFNKTKESTNLLTKELLKQGEGARGNLMVQWGGLMNGGHSMVYEVKDGQLRILDGQSNKVYKNPYSILKETNGVYQYARLDNVDFDPKTIQRCCR